MNLMEKIYFQLHSEGLVGSAEEFSTQWCSRSKHWFAVQRRSVNGFSVVTAIHCLRKVHVELAKSKVRRDKFGSFEQPHLTGPVCLLMEMQRGHLIHWHDAFGLQADDGPTRRTN